MKPVHSLAMLAMLALLSGTSQAASPEYCQSQAQELAMKTGSNIIPDMSARQRGRLQQLAAEICAKYANDASTRPSQNTTEAEKTPTVANTESDNNEDSNWLTRLLTPAEEKFADDSPIRPKRGRLHQ